jgi:hypothetical protein
MNIKSLLDAIILVSAILLCVVVTYSIFQYNRKRAIRSLNDHRHFLVNVNEYIHGQILGIFDYSLKLYRRYGLTEPEKEGYPDIQELHEAAIAALRTFVQRSQLSHDLLKKDLDGLTKPGPNSTIDSLVEWARVKGLVDKAWFNWQTVQAELLTLKTRLRYQARAEEAVPKRA